MSDDIRVILNSVRQDSWAKKLRDIRERIDKYDDSKTRKSSDEKEKIEKHLYEILPTYRDVFHTHNTARRKHGELLKRDDRDETCLPHYHIGIFLVGYSSLPIALSLAEIQPTEQIYFLYSSDTKEYLKKISNRLKAMLNGSNDELLELVQNASNSEIKDPSDPVSTFKEIKEIIDSIDESEDKRIALDLTGGKKTMIGGGFTAGAIWASRWSAEAEKLKSFCDMYYIDSEDYDPIHGRPKAGTEFLSRLENPYDVYNVQSVHQAEKLFENHNYEAAAFLWNSVSVKLNSYAKRYGLENEHDVVQKNLNISDCYSYWDAFDYLNAEYSKRNYGAQWNYNAKHTYCAIDVLDILREVEDIQTLFAQESRIIHYAVDRYQNGIRRMESDRYDDAIVRFTQVVEILCRYHIYRIAEGNGLTDNSHNPVNEQNCLDEEWSITKLIHFLFGERARYYIDGGDYYQIAHLNECLNIPEYHGYDCPNEITDLIQPRNDFVHVNPNPGWDEMEEDAEKLKELANTFLKNFYSRYYSNRGLTFDDLLELHRFRR